MATASDGASLNIHYYHYHYKESFHGGLSGISKTNPHQKYD